MAGRNLNIGDRVRAPVNRRPSLVIRKAETYWILQQIRERHASIPPGNRNDIISVGEFNAMHQLFLLQFSNERSSVFSHNKLKELHRVWRVDTIGAINESGVENTAETVRNVSARQRIAIDKKRAKENASLAKKAAFKLHTENLLAMSTACEECPYFHQQLHFDNPGAIESGKLYFDKVIKLKQQLAEAAHESMECREKKELG
jgi:hypothetical protein